MCASPETETDRQAGRQTDRQTDRQTGRQADRQTGRHGKLHRIKETYENRQSNLDGQKT